MYYGPSSLPGYQADTYYMNGLGAAGDDLIGGILGSVNSYFQGHYASSVAQTQANVGITQAGYASNVALAQNQTAQLSATLQAQLEESASKRRFIAYTALGVGTLAIIGILGASYLRSKR